MRMASTLTLAAKTPREIEIAAQVIAELHRQGLRVTVTQNFDQLTVEIV